MMSIRPTRNVRPLLATIVFLVAATPSSLSQTSQSTSPNTAEKTQAQAQPQAQFGNSVVAFGSYAAGTSISAQFQSVGIDFSGSGPVIAADKAFGGNVLSGTPVFAGAITGTFVDPNTGQRATVSEFSVEAGSFESLNSTQLRWFDQSGNVLGAQTNQGLGFYTFNVTSTTPIASWTIQLVGADDNGFAVDQVSFPTPVSLYLVDPYLLPGSPSSIPASTIASVVATPLIFPSVEAGGLVVDGSSVVVAIVASPAQQSVTFTATNTLGLLPYNQSFLTTAPGVGKSSLTVTPQELVSYNSSYYAMVLVQSPAAGVQPDYTTSATVTATVGSSVDRAGLALVPTPVLLVHGLWGNLQSLQFIQQSMQAAPPWSNFLLNQAITTVNPICYSIYIPFDSSSDPVSGSTNPCEQTSQDALSKATSNLFGQLDTAHVSGARIDLVGHSMGGLVARHYTAVPQYWSSTRGRQQGLFRSVVTIDTPENGSAIATYLLSAANRTYQSSCTTQFCSTLWKAPVTCLTVSVLSQCLYKLGMPLAQSGAAVTSGAVASLVPGGTSLTSAPAPVIRNTNWYAVGSVFADGTTPQSLLRLTLNSLLGGTYAQNTTPPTLTSLLGNLPNDVIVTSASQLPGGALQSKQYATLAHAPTPSASVLSVLFSGSVNYNVTQSSGVAFLIQCWLKTGGNSACQNQIGSQAVPVADTTAPMVDSAGQIPAKSVQTGVKVPVFENERLSMSASSIKAALMTPTRIPVNVARGTIARIELAQASTYGSYDEAVEGVLAASDDASSSSKDERSASTKSGPATETFVTFTPTRLGIVSVMLTVRFSDGVVAQKEIVLDVVPPLFPPSDFKASDYGTVVLTKNGIPEQMLLPRAHYPGLATPIYIDSQFVTYKAVQSADNPVVLIEPGGRIKALNPGVAIVEARYGNIVDRVRVVVKDSE